MQYIRSKSSYLFFVVTSLLLINLGLILSLSVEQSPNIDEPAHLAAGMKIWQYGAFDLYCVNPPLMRSIAALPILFMPHEEVWGDFEGAPSPRPEFLLGAQFVESHPAQWKSYLKVGRFALLPFSIIGGLFCFLWSKELFGWKAGLMSLTLWCFSPNILTWSSLICTDGVASSIGLGAGYFFWRWLQKPSWSRASIAGLFFGLAQLSKMTWILMFGLWPALWVMSLLIAIRRERLRVSAAQLGSILVIGVYVLNVGYAFDGMLLPLGDYEFESQLFSGEDSNNRFRNSSFAKIPIPFPRQYVRGIDLQRCDFENGMPSFACGHWEGHGWWWYYLLGLAIKIPLGTLCLAALAIFSFLKYIHSRGEITWISPPAVMGVGIPLIIFVSLTAFVSSQDGFSKHFRYILPALPFGFIVLSSLANKVTAAQPLLSLAILGSLVWTTFSSMIAYPHTMGYFNELVGGSENGHHYMLGSSYSWSQDHFRLRAWLSRHPEVDTPYMHLERSVSLERLELKSRGKPPKLNRSARSSGEAYPRLSGPIPGWHVMSVQHIHDPDGGYLYFLEFVPVAKIGRSINVYYFDRDTITESRRELNLPAVIHHPKLNLRDDALSAAARKERIVVAVLIQDSSGSPESEVETALGHDSIFAVRRLPCNGLQESDLSAVDVIVVPGGKASSQGIELGANGRDVIRSFVERGGGYIGICAGAYLATINHDWSLKLVNANTYGGVRFVPGHGNVSAATRGWGEANVEIAGIGNGLFVDVPSQLILPYTGGPIFSRANVYSLPDYHVLASYRSELVMHPFQIGSMLDTAAVVASSFGRGKIVLFSPHPESIDSTVPMLIQAVRFCAQK